MANAVLVNRLYAAVGNAVYVQSITATSTVPTGNAVLVQNLALASAAPTANAGPDQAGVEPGAVVTLDGSGSSASSGTTLSAFGWALVGGPAVTLSGTGATRTFTAPGSVDGVALTFRLTVTDSGGATSTDDVTVLVLNSTRFELSAGGQWVPELRHVFDGSVWS